MLLCCPRMLSRTAFSASGTTSGPFSRNPHVSRLRVPAATRNVPSAGLPSCWGPATMLFFLSRQLRPSLLRVSLSPPPALLRLLSRHWTTTVDDEGTTRQSRVRAEKYASSWHRSLDGAVGVVLTALRFQPTTLSSVYLVYVLRLDLSDQRSDQLLRLPV